MLGLYANCTNGPGTACMPDGTCAVTLQAPHLDALGREAASWLWANPNKTVLSFSHAPHVHLEPRAGMAGPREVTTQRGLLLVTAD